MNIGPHWLAGMMQLMERPQLHTLCRAYGIMGNVLGAHQT